VKGQPASRQTFRFRRASRPVGAAGWNPSTVLHDKVAELAFRPHSAAFGKRREPFGGVRLSWNAIDLPPNRRPLRVFFVETQLGMHLANRNTHQFLHHRLARVVEVVALCLEGEHGGREGRIWLKAVASEGE